MSHLSYLLSAFLFLSAVSYAQKKWDGGGGNNQWNNALNWTGNTVPLSGENVVLDNSIFVANYTVMLPATAVTVKSVTITPAAGKTIELTLPAQNLQVPGFSANGPGYGLVLNTGATFRNSSGAGSGNAVRVLDSIRINNGGRYIHNSASSHSSNIQVLSAAGGTEAGILELNIPMASSTISLSGRTFGRLVLNAAAAGGTCNYTAVGTSRVMVRDNLELDRKSTRLNSSHVKRSRMPSSA